ncbi:hypothetical protein [Marinomonas shanghaiensis]|uniref:hypothetical protein n=1 Tax=Marinomonas shanghaiensis TaxID=2202418 RepID=UPI003A945E84
MSEKIEKTSMGMGMVVGIFLSGLYAVAALIYLFYRQSLCDPLDLNEIGDYLAGVFSPLAFLWLVVGYVMQNRELKNQIVEFKASVKVAENNFNLQSLIFEKEQHEKFLANQPNFWSPVLSIDESQQYGILKAVNVGSKAFKIQVELENGLPCSEMVSGAEKGESISIKTNIPYFVDRNDDGSYHNDQYWISYLDNAGIFRRALLHISWVFQTVDGPCIAHSLITMPSTPEEFSLRILEE